ncbi:dihydroxyacetone kinase subunit DhaK [Acetobacteraceae bacterium H6797]|nr:dihydroxyacetone kinase subunit DhaK [Acetobacteraceae bacterium H6797]
MKKLVNDPRRVVRQMLEGLVDLDPQLALLEHEDVVVRAEEAVPEQRPVAVISGGGAGHEPAHAGYVGLGMLSAAVSGDVFTSPSVDAVLSAIQSVAGPRGALLVVKNYTGDRLNFGLAAELASASGIPTRVVVVADDVALRDTVPPERRRGIAGTVLVHKIAGAAAAAGLSLDEVVAEATSAADALGSMGVALGACTVPAAGEPSFTLGDDEIELGLGIHGEQGVRRAPMQPADNLVDTLVETILADQAIGEGQRVALLVNGLGGTPPMELAIIARRALERLRAKGIVVERAWSGNFMTALEMPGCSLTLLRVDDVRLIRLDAPTTARAWGGDGRLAARKLVPAPPDVVAPADVSPGPLTAALRDAATRVASALEAAEPELTKLDSHAGDGDLGISMARAASAIRALPEASWNSPAEAMEAAANALRRAIGGSSGPFYATALLRASRSLQTNPDAWSEAFSAAVAAISDLGGAKPGDRTMLDALHPAAEAFVIATARGASLLEAWEEACEAAAEGTAATAGMRPRLGRAAYLGERALGVPDAGASAVLVWMKALLPTKP